MILGFVLVGGYDRLHDLGGVSIWTDEAQSTLLAFSVLKHGYPIIVSQHVINNWEPLYPYLEALSIRVLGATNLAFRLPSALLGIALIPLAYSVGARLRDRYVGIALAAMLAFSSEYIAWSRQARWYMLLVVLLALGFLLAMTWHYASSRRLRTACVLGMVVLAVFAGLASLSLFLLYLPGILAAGLVYFLAAGWEPIKRWFGRPAPTVSPTEPSSARIIPYRYRPWVLLAILGAMVGLVVVLQKPLELAYAVAFTRLVGFPPHPLAWSNTFGPYLLEYYPGVIALAGLGAVFITGRRNPIEIALAAFCISGFLSVSLFASLTNGPTPVSGAAPFVSHAAYERHIVPLLFFLFLVASLAIVELCQRTIRFLSPRLQGGPHLRGVVPALFGIAVVVVLVLPGVVAPSNVTIYGSRTASPADSLVPWVAFSLDPVNPSALWRTPQLNYQLAAEYVVGHRNSSDVVATSDPGPTAVYCGSAQYWVNARPIPSTIIYTTQGPTFFQTGSLLVSNSSQLEGLLLNGSGWFISSVPIPNPAAFPSGMSYVISDFMSRIPAASDVSISLYRWNLSTPASLIEMLAARTPAVGILGTNLTVLAGWATTSGVTENPFRDFLVPLAPSLLRYVGPGLLPLAVLFNVYNHRPDLQSAFPEVLYYPSNDTALAHWAKQVVTGVFPDPAFPALAPYSAWYQAHG
ncbi:MAG: glycosyltransferase family 39 protein [Thermoplasmata archaeon]|nr:glycosyltransferase family 39 protein [Thermoplasmata archaeon]